VERPDRVGRDGPRAARPPRDDAQGGRALKLVNADTGEDAEHTERFRREVQVLATVRHPAVVGLLDAGEVAGKPWLVMEYVAGQNLEDRLTERQGLDPGARAGRVRRALSRRPRARPRPGHPPPRHQGRERGRGHHRARAVLVDFGVALHLSASRLTKAGNVMGTMVYLPPEVLEGGAPDGASHDQYALGQLLAETLSGELLFRGGPGGGGPTRFAQLLDGKGHAIDPGPKVPDKVRAGDPPRATDPEPAERFPSMRAFGDALVSTLTRPQRRLDLERRLGRGQESSGRWKWVLAGLVALGLLAGFALGATVAALVLLYVVLA
jgi:serine/threonine protein kinase